MIKLEQAIIVEGRYDKARLAGIFDALIIETNGFGIMKDAAKLELIRGLALKTGIIIATDSDRAGFKIRGFIKGAVNRGKIYEVFMPDIYGKEKRKRAPSGEGLIGVEGVDNEIIIEAFRRAGLVNTQTQDPVYGKALLTQLGLCGGKNSAALRRLLAERLGLPKNMNSNTLAKVLPMMLSRDVLENMVKELGGSEE